jgi:hypothetical protein
VGVTPRLAATYLQTSGHDRLHCLGPLDDPSVYQAAADVYIEGFPFGSQTALLETVMAGVPAVAACDPPCRLLATDDDPLEGLLVTPQSEDDYVARTRKLIRDSGERIRAGQCFRDRMLSAHTGEGWLTSLHALYSEIENVGHSPERIGVAPCLYTDTDMALSAWNEAIAVTTSKRINWSDAENLFRFSFETAYRLRQRGYYRNSFRLLWKAIRLGGKKWKLTIAMAKLLLHWLVNHFRGLRKTLRRHSFRV